MERKVMLTKILLKLIFVKKIPSMNYEYQLILDTKIFLGKDIF